ncbi:conserved exported hypothetical protein [Methylocella tundrae]|uniref:MetA-pathway of phenol degradation n=1 Tax=Methylocella tundrae TaxID=227605 RepID=A0A8B6M724_METTU|nr:conserved exported hypothetical protein [Methylocella tundrae]VTZ50143.1 conserved exported hypothetical protein [Methylocella tundrae]
MPSKPDAPRAKTARRNALSTVAACMTLGLAAPARAADAPPADSAPVQSSDSPIADYFANWQNRVEQAQASQPHWMTPMTTVTPRLEQEYRYDQYKQYLQNGAQIDNFGGGKGLELIPTTTNEILLNIPAYQHRSNVKPATGFADGNFVTIKQRLLSANEENGNYILSAFLGVQAPTGITAFTNRPAWIVTPTLAGGIGWGDFDIQGTVSLPLPTDNLHAIGYSIVTSATLQYHFWEYFWPEFAFNDTQWTSGVRAGRNQLFVSPGIVFGRFQIYKRVKLSFGISYQVAVVPDHAITVPLTPVYNHAWLLSMRMTF